jgi:hypothetical protein
VFCYISDFCACTTEGNLFVIQTLNNGTIKGCSSQRHSLNFPLPSHKFKSKIKIGLFIVDTSVCTLFSYRPVEGQWLTQGCPWMIQTDIPCHT